MGMPDMPFLFNFKQVLGTFLGFLIIFGLTFKAEANCIDHLLAGTPAKPIEMGFQYKGEQLLGVHYLKDHQKLKHKLSFKNGQIYLGEEQLRCLLSCRLIYIVDLDGKIYAGFSENQVFHHSSLSSGKDVLAAGEIKIWNGQLRFINNASGHYKGNWGNVIALRVFIKDGFPLPKSIGFVQSSNPAHQNPVYYFDLKEMIATWKQNKAYSHARLNSYISDALRKEFEPFFDQFP